MLFLKIAYCTFNFAYFRELFISHLFPLADHQSRNPLYKPVGELRDIKEKSFVVFRKQLYRDCVYSCFSQRRLALGSHSSSAPSHRWRKHITQSLSLWHKWRNVCCDISLSVALWTVFAGIFAINFIKCSFWDCIHRCSSLPKPSELPCCLETATF